MFFLSSIPIVTSSAVSKVALYILSHKLFLKTGISHTFPNLTTLFKLLSPQYIVSTVSIKSLMQLYACVYRQ